MWINILTKLLTYGPMAYKAIQPFAKTITTEKLDKEIMKKLNEYDNIFSETIRKSYKNLIIDFVLIILMLIFSLHAKMKGYEFSMLLLISIIYIFSIIIILRRYFLLFKLYKQHKSFINKYYLIWKSTKSKKFGEKKTEFIELAYTDMYKTKVGGWEHLHTLTSIGGLVKSKKEILEDILDRVNYILKSSLRKKIGLYIITFILLIVCTYSIKWLLIDVNTGFNFIDYITYPFKQLYFIWFK